MTAAARVSTIRSAAAERRVEFLAYAAILAVAAALRLANLGVRGTWDADQGHDMLVLRSLVLDGQFPLLGPPTSIGDFHHGVLYYLILAPAAALSRADPIAVMTFIALCGVAAVAVTGWLARSIAGPVAGLIAGLIVAVSSSAVEESIFIWNPNLIALSSSIALAAAWRAWIDGRARWWVVAGGAAVVTMHCHVLGAILTPVILGLLIADVGRRARRGDRRGAGRVGGAAMVWIGLGLVSYVPLLIHELGSDFSELRAAAAFVAGGSGPAAVALPVRIPTVGLRVVGWPLAGLITAAPIATILAAALVVGLAVWRGWLSPSDSERTAVRWLAIGLAGAVLALAVTASSLATVVAGLPNDHYHAFADPIVVVLAAIGLGALTRARPSRVVVGRVIVAVVVMALVGWNLANQPPTRASDGGWVAARTAAERVLAARSGTGKIVLASLPSFKSDEALRMPLVATGADVVSAGSRLTADSDQMRVILCDQLFHESIGADCGGPAEDAWLVDFASGLVAGDATGDPPSLVDRFEAAPGRWVSVYRR